MDDLAEIERAIKSTLTHTSPMGESWFEEHWKPKFNRIKAVLMKELISALSFTDRVDTTLTGLIADAMQDSQYSPHHSSIREKLAVLNKYEKQFGQLTVGQIRALGTTSQ
jgi:hypothetical protein